MYSLSFYFSQAPPFVMRKGDLKSFTNESEEFEGLAIDILQEMRKELGFNYKIYLAPDGKFGVRDRLTGEWNGVVKEIIDKVIPCGGLFKSGVIEESQLERSSTLVEKAVFVTCEVSRHSPRSVANTRI